MSIIERIVLDTSTLVSAILLPRSMPRQAFMRALASSTLCASPSTLAELEEVLSRNKFDRYLDRESRMDFFLRYRHQVLSFPVTEAEERSLPQPCRDPRDDKFLALALHCSANVVVSSDDDLLALHPWQGIPILNPAKFLK